MHGKLALSIALVLISTPAWAAPLKVDLSANGQVEPGWFDWNTGGRQDNVNVEKRFQNQTDFDDDFTIKFTKIDSRNRAAMNDAIPQHDLLEDAFKESDPFTMTIVGLAPGVYTLTTYDHDTNEDVVNDDGTLNITVKDADGTRLVADHVQQTWGPKPATVCSVTFTFRSDGSDVVLTFADNNDGIHNEAYLNGFILDRAVEPGKASAPQPADKATDVPCDVILRWTAAETAAATNGHKVFLSKALDDVKNGTAAADRGFTTDPLFDTVGLPTSLEFGTTYYWRIDEGSAAKGYTAGNVWSFTTEPYAYPIPSKSITATASSSLNDKTTPGKTIDGSGLDKNDLHSTVDSDMWLSAGTQSAWIQYQFDKVYSLHEMWVWNYNQTVESIVGFGLKDLVIEYSVDGVVWTPLAASTQFARAPGAAAYAHNTTVAFGGVPAQFVRFTAKSSWGGIQYGLSEVRFYYVPVQAREPQPASNAAGVGPQVTLHWRAGRKAASHDVYLSTDKKAVQDARVPPTHAGITSFDAGTLSLATTYYWRVDEVNTTSTPKSWAGDVWSFSTAQFLIVDDFESYTDDEGKRVYELWIDGWGTNNNGSQVGYANAPFAEQTLVNNGKQSMPMSYNNAAAAALSEATRTFDAPQDWTRAGIKALAIYFRGEPNNTGGQIYVKINNSKVVYDGDASNITKSRWTQWNIDLSSLGGLRNVAKLTIGVEGAGRGRIYVDDVQLHPSRCIASLNHIEGDLNNDCVVDYRDLDLMANDWLKGDATLATAPAAPSATGLIAQYKLDGNVLDSSGNNLNGTIIGNPAFTPGIAGQALTFDGAGDYVDCTNNVKWDAITDKITVSVWFRVDAFDVTYQPIVTKGDSSWRIARNSETNNLQWRCNGPTPTFRINGEVNVNDGEWHHAAGTYDGATAQLYVDGKLDGTMATAGVIARNTQKVFLGGNSEQAARLWKGAIDEVRIYNRALTEAEVRYLADQTPGDGRLYLPLMSPAEIYSPEPANQKSVNLKDFTKLAGKWLDQQLWP